MVIFTQLSIKNFKLIKQVDLNLEEGLNIISGTTGAGKSMLIQALKLLLGGKSSKSLYHNNEKPIELSGQCQGTDPTINDILSEVGIELDDEALILRRQITPSGQNRCFINDTPVTVTLLKRIGERIVDFHGQHEEQSILSPSVQGEILDRVAENRDLLKDYQACLATRELHIQQANELKQMAHERDDKIQLLQFKANEIDEVAPKSGEIDELQTTVNRQKNKNRINELLSNANYQITEQESSIQQSLAKIGDDIAELAQLDESFNDVELQIQQTIDQVNDLSFSLSDLQNKMSFDSDDFDELQSRLFALKSLEKKFTRSLDEIIEYRESIQSELNTIQNLDNELAAINESIEADTKELIKLGKKLHQRRSKAANAITKEINKELKALALDKASFAVEIVFRLKKGTDIDSLPSLAFGMDSIAFTAILNPGDDFKPIKGMASGGETSRIMLAIKKVLAHRDSIGTLVFDEIDSDTGGRLGSVIGEKLLEISKNHQVLCITHLPQIASFGQVHLKVEKSQEASATATEIRALSKQDRIKELAQMMEGNTITTMGMKHADEMLQLAQKRRTEIFTQ